jgi:hypothetical protein
MEHLQEREPQRAGDRVHWRLRILCHSFARRLADTGTGVFSS